MLLFLVVKSFSLLARFFFFFFFFPGKIPLRRTRSYSLSLSLTHTHTRERSRIHSLSLSLRCSAYYRWADTGPIWTRTSTTARRLRLPNNNCNTTNKSNTLKRAKDSIYNTLFLFASLSRARTNRSIDRSIKGTRSFLSLSLSSLLSQYLFFLEKRLKLPERERKRDITRSNIGEFGWTFRTRALFQGEYYY